MQSNRFQHPSTSPSPAADLLAEAEANRLKGQYGTAKHLAEQAAASAETYGERQILLLALLLTAKVDTVQGDLKAAYAGLSRATLAARSGGDEPLLCTALYMSAHIKKLLGFQDDALSDIDEALEIATRLDDEELLYWCYNRAGIVQGDLGHFETANEFLGKALEYSARLHDEEKFCILNNMTDNIALWEDDLSQNGHHLPRDTLELALGYARGALTYARKAENSYREAMILGNIGLVYGLLGLYREAAEAFDRSYEIATARSYRSLVLTAHHYRGKVLVLQGDLPGALVHLKIALEMAEDMAEDLSSRDICRCLATACEAMGDTTAALTHYRNYHKFDRKIASAQAALKASVMVDREALITARAAAEEARDKHQEMASRSAELEHRVESLTKAAREADRKANTDALTGLFNRHYLDVELARRIDQARLNGERLSIALLDIDHFKQVNDRFGHAIGDAVLKAFGGILLGQLRPGDVAMRYGGEEMLVVFSNLEPTHARTASDKLRARIEGFDWPSIAEGLAVTASIGVAAFDGTEDARSLLKRADDRLYEAKSLGRNRVCA